MNLLKTKSKLIISVFGIIVALLLIWTLFFMTQYSNLHVVYSISESGAVVIEPSTTMEVGDITLSNSYLNSYLSSSKPGAPEVIQNASFDSVKQVIYDYQMNLNSFNNYLLALLVVGLCMFALLLIFANQSRKVYYKSNLIVGILAPTVMLVMLIIGLVWIIRLIGIFNANKDLFQVTAIMEDYTISSAAKRTMRTRMDFSEMIAKYGSGVNTTTMILVMIYLIIVIVCATFVIVHTVLKFKNTEQRRKEIIERARVAA